MGPFGTNPVEIDSEGRHVERATVVPMWVVVRIGRGKKPYAVRLGESGPFAVGQPGRWRPRGAIITFASRINAEARAAKLNLADREARR